MKKTPQILAIAIICSFMSASLLGTNGMNMEGYGPVSTALGGTGVAIDTGSAASMNNPATLVLMKKDARLDFALGRLGPEVSTEYPGMGKVDSASDEFYMPAFGFVKRKGESVYGITVFGQGGMGTEFSGNSFMGLGRGLGNMTEVSIGRLMIPFATSVSEKLGIGGSIDAVWAGMDLCMAMTGDQLMDLANPLSQQSGKASGTLLQMLGQMQMMPEFAYFDFANSSPFSGKAKGYGYAAKLGIVYDVSPELRIGASYHTPTWLDDLETSGSSVAVGVPGMEMELVGDMTVVDFQWPASYALGFSYGFTQKLKIAGDVKQVAWSNVMDSFRMRFVANDDAANGPMSGLDLDAELYQKWDEQNVYSIGLEYSTVEKGIYRIGFNHATNPVPDNHLNPLFPATVENHITFGSEHRLGQNSKLGWSGVLGLENEVAMPNGMISRHKQLNFQIMYTRFWGE